MKAEPAEESKTRFIVRKDEAQQCFDAECMTTAHGMLQYILTQSLTPCDGMKVDADLGSSLVGRPSVK